MTDSNILSVRYPKLILRAYVGFWKSGYLEEIGHECT